jgi:hypothetical protein
VAKSAGNRMLALLTLRRFHAVTLLAGISGRRKQQSQPHIRITRGHSRGLAEARALSSAV